MENIHITQGGTLRLEQNELYTLKSTFLSCGINLSCIDFNQNIVSFPQAYIGYICLPHRKIIIDPKHDGVTFKHIMRIYYFLYASDSSDLDDPIYDIDNGSLYDVIKSFLNEIDVVTKKGLPVEYINKQCSLQYLRGNINLVNTAVNLTLRKREVFDCEFDELSHDIPINQILYKALLKVAKIYGSTTESILKNRFNDVSEVCDIPKSLELNNNIKYCKKALILAYMILNDLNISDYGNSSYGQNLLINFDRVFEEFIKKILTVYSDDYNFTYWDKEKNYALCKDCGNEYFKSYIPDMLYRYQNSTYPNTAYCILDMKNKTSRPFNNSDVYQMFFYANQLKSKKVILCYPSSSDIDNAFLKFNNEEFIIKKIYAVYINIAGDKAKDFKRNIYSFINNVKKML